MPPVFRHVVPNVPAFTAGNGKPCYDPDEGVPVYRAESKIWIEPTWNPDICNDSAWFAEIGPYCDPSWFTRWAGAAPTVAQITAWAQTDPATGAKPTFFYNAPSHSLAGWMHYASTGGAKDFPAASSGWSVRIAPVTVVYELLWDAANAFWQWRVRMTALRVSRRFFYDDGTGEAEGIMSLGAPTGMRFTSAQLTDDLRPGAGITLTPSTTTNIMRASTAILRTSH